MSVRFTTIISGRPDGRGEAKSAGARAQALVEASDADGDVLWLTARVSVYDLKLDSVPVH
ncbi:hypothetical protein O7614_10460 [Micromonospora sp. WMMD961]|uniref:hypothetical protein n=1 Tax=Micromonospora sp. WMMD961 TaxID=3016100 RepID=UPI00241811C6|nr:hypothetical protein [Micromonospora sp. WMMD961]MDG4780062.1 hypothetical protein [Micromonospora sp. WMMD961]